MTSNIKDELHLHASGLAATILDIDVPMQYIERIMSEYNTDNRLPSGLLFCKGTRDWLVDGAVIDMHRKRGTLLNTPQHPYRAIPLLRDMLEYMQHRHTGHSDLLINNPFVESNVRYQMHRERSEVSIIRSYIPEISLSDYEAVVNAYIEISERSVVDVFTAYPDSLYSLDASTDKYILWRHDDIRAFRFDELRKQGVDYEYANAVASVFT